MKAKIQTPGILPTYRNKMVYVYYLLAFTAVAAVSTFLYFQFKAKFVEYAAILFALGVSFFLSSLVSWLVKPDFDIAGVKRKEGSFAIMRAVLMMFGAVWMTIMFSLPLGVLGSVFLAMLVPVLSVACLSAFQK